jgi:succinoglycan biosynthesis transport protein ExoP
MDLDALLSMLRRRSGIGLLAGLLAFLAAGLTIPSLPARYRAEARVFCSEPLPAGVDGPRTRSVLEKVSLANLLPLLNSLELGRRVWLRLRVRGEAPATPDLLMAGLEVKKIEGTGYYRLSLIDSAQERSARALNFLVEEAALLWRERIRAEATTAAVQVEGRLAEVQERTARIRLELEAARAAAELQGPAPGYAEELRNLEDAVHQRQVRAGEILLEEERVQGELKALGERLEVNAENIDLHLEGLPAMGWYRELNEQVVKGEIKLLQTLRTRTERHPEVVAQRGEVEESKRLLSSVFEEGQILNQYLERARRLVESDQERKGFSKRIHLQSLAALLAATRKALEEDRARLAALQGMRERYLELTGAILGLERMKGELELTSQDLRVLRSADLRPLAAFERATRAERQGHTAGTLYALAGALALLIGLGAATLRETLDDAAKDSLDLRRRTGLAPLVIIPFEPRGFLAGETGSREGAGGTGRRRRGPRVEEPFISLARLLLAQGDLRTVLVAGVEKGIGRSLITAETARAAARLGRKAAAVDADARQPTLHRAFGLDNRRGLTDLLNGELALRERIRALGEGRVVLASALRRFQDRHRAPEGGDLPEEVLVVPAGRLLANCGRLLEGEAMGALLRELRESRHLVLIDSAPLGLSGEALSLARQVDGVILVARAGVTRAGAILWARKSLAQVGGNLLGVVLNCAARAEVSFSPRRVRSPAPPALVEV